MFGYLLVLLSLLVPQAHAQEDTRVIRDVFAFLSAEDETRLVFGLTTAELKRDYLYQFNFDTNQDGVEDRVVQVTLSDTEATVTLPSTPERTGQTVQPVKIDRISGAITTHANPVVIAERGKSVRAFVGLRDDPVGGKERAGNNTQAIVIELPLSEVLAEKKSDMDVWISIFTKS